MENDYFTANDQLNNDTMIQLAQLGGQYTAINKVIISTGYSVPFSKNINGDWIESPEIMGNGSPLFFEAAMDVVLELNEPDQELFNATVTRIKNLLSVWKKKDDAVRTVLHESTVGGRAKSRSIKRTTRRNKKSKKRRVKSRGKTRKIRKTIRKRERKTIRKRNGY